MQVNFKSCKRIAQKKALSTYNFQVPLTFRGFRLQLQILQQRNSTIQIYFIWLWISQIVPVSATFVADSANFSVSGTIQCSNSFFFVDTETLEINKKTRTMRIPDFFISMLLNTLAICKIQGPRNETSFLIV